MVTKILPNAVASGGPLQPEPSTRIFASPPSSLCLPGVPSLDGQGILKFLGSSVSFLRASSKAEGLFLGPLPRGHRGRAGKGGGRGKELRSTTSAAQ